MLYSTGRRKTSSARIFMKNGVGKIYINNLYFKKYFFCKIKRKIILFPFKIIKGKYDFFFNKFNFYITVKGGGISSQAIAIKHGISRVLLKYNNNFKKKFKLYRLITRDSRKVERKKYGFIKSRCKHQYSKR